MVSDDLAMLTPLIDIRPTKKWHEVDVAELWRYRDMLLLLAQRDITVRYRQTLLGVSWTLLQPLGPMLVFTLIFTRVVSMPAVGHPYAVFVLSGLVPWTYFSVGATSASTSLVTHANMVSKVYFPRIILPSAAVLARLTDLLVGCGLVLALTLTYHLRPSVTIVFLPGIIALLMLLTFAVGLNLAAINTVYRDAQQALPLLLQLWLFLTPIIYSRGAVPAEWRWLLALNPVTGVIEAFRAVLLAEPVPWLHLGGSVVATFVLLGTGLVLFVRMEKHLADYL